ncbi:MAG: CocE/NonD family hydrolase [Cyclonatronaceae bacterium]
MRYIDHFPETVQEIENEWITMPDGVKLAARIWLPESANVKPVPAILEYIPYRKRDFKRLDDEVNHRYFAGYGYAGVRVDIRGSGDSEGILTDEYLEPELSDGEKIIEWLAEQPWCDGNVGMIGISWGGFNGLQIAARRPEALKAVITVCSTDDRYADDVHYMGGCLLGDNLSWASVMFDRNSLPPDPEIVGDKWKSMWLERLEKSGLWKKNWLEHQRRDDFWKHGSICENYDDVQCPVMAVSGWADGYSNSVFRMLEHLNVPRMGLVGAWSHRYPHDGIPGPAIGFLQECLRWWDKWLKGKDNGIDREPMLKAWMQESMPPSTSYEERPGYWLGLNEWPSRKVRNIRFLLKNGHTLKVYEKAVEPKPMWVQSPVNLGMFAGKWCSYSAAPDLPADQREEDGGALIFDSDPLKEDLEIIGRPCADLQLEVNQPVAMVAVRLTDVRPDGKATRVTYGLLNLTHRNGHESPEKLEPGKKYKVRVKLNEIAHIFPEGNQIRVSISTSYYPIAWPSPELVMMKVYGEESSIDLPILMEEGDAPVSFEEPVAARPSTRKGVLQAPSVKWHVDRDLVFDRSEMDVLKDEGRYYLDEIQLEMAAGSREKYAITSDDLESIRAEVNAKKSLKRGDWQITTRTRTILTSDKDCFYLHATLDAFEGDERVFSKNWREKIPRDHI